MTTQYSFQRRMTSSQFLNPKDASNAVTSGLLPVPDTSGAPINTLRTPTVRGAGDALHTGEGEVGVQSTAVVCCTECYCDQKLQCTKKRHTSGLSCAGNVPKYSKISERGPGFGG